MAGQERAGIVHRLDKGTSGVMVVAKNNESHANLSKQLSTRDMGRIYLLLCDLALKENCVIDRAIGRHPQNRLKNAIISNAKPSKSAFANILTSQNKMINLVAAKLFSGRTHQIRVHMASIGHPLLGDKLYGGSLKLIQRQALHSYYVEFDNPITKKRIQISCKLPADMDKLKK